MTSSIQIVQRPPTPQEYRALCVAVGWEQAINFEAAPASLARSLYHVVAADGERVVGMGRIVGDGAIYFYIQDVAVHPEYQHRGIGHMILTDLMAYLRRHAPAKAFLGLFAAGGTHSFYRRYGFEQYEQLVGLFRVTPIEAFSVQAK